MSNLKILSKEDFFTIFLKKEAIFTKEAIENGFDINATSGVTQRTAIHIAISSYKKQHVETLISKGADLTMKSNYGHTPLATAVCGVTISEKYQKEKFNDSLDILELVLIRSIENRKKFWDKEGWRTRSGAIFVLRHRYPLSDKIVNLLLQILDDESWHVRYIIVKRFIQYKNSNKIDFDRFTPLLRDKSWKVREITIKFFGEHYIFLEDIIKEINILKYDENDNVKKEVDKYNFLLKNKLDELRDVQDQDSHSDFFENEDSTDKTFLIQKEPVSDQYNCILM
jgi:hypothetical protein